MTSDDIDNPLLAAVSVGKIVSGKYRLGGLIGTSASSIVVEAQHLQNGQRYAMKLLDPDLVAMSGGSKRLVDEIRIIAQLTSSHVVRVFAVGALDTGEPYLVMEYVEGTDLANVLADTGPLWITATADYVREACEALGQAHALGLVHGGLKPKNLLLTKRPDGGRSVKVADFGVGFAMHDPQLSGAHHAASFSHAAPEQLLGQPIDARTDAWALGIVLFELVSGRPPFSPLDLHKLLEGGRVTIPPLRSPHGAVPTEFEAVVRRCLAVHARQRFADMEELAGALAPFASADNQETWAIVKEPRASSAPRQFAPRELEPPPPPPRPSVNRQATANVRPSANRQATAHLRPSANRQATANLRPSANPNRISWSDMPTQEMSRREADMSLGEDARTLGANATVGADARTVGEDARTLGAAARMLGEDASTLDQQRPAQGRAHASDHPLLVAEVLPTSTRRTAIIAAVALALLLILPLIYLHSLAKKTEVTPIPGATAPLVTTTRGR